MLPIRCSAGLITLLGRSIKVKKNNGSRKNLQEATYQSIANNNQSINVRLERVPAKNGIFKSRTKAICTQQHEMENSRRYYVGTIRTKYGLISRYYPTFHTMTFTIWKNFKSFN